MYKSGQNLTRDTFKAEFTDEDGKNISVSIYPPKMSVLRTLYSLSDRSDGEAMEDTIYVLAAILNSNREGRKFSADEAADLFDVTDLQDFLTEFFEWVGNLKKK